MLGRTILFGLMDNIVIRASDEENDGLERAVDESSGGSQ
jgi:hypothetical protein